MTTFYSLDGHNVTVTTKATIDLRSINAHAAFHNVSTGKWDERMFSLWVEFVGNPVAKKVDEYELGDLIAVRDDYESPWQLRRFMWCDNHGRVHAQDKLGRVYEWEYNRPATHDEVQTYGMDTE